MNFKFSSRRMYKAMKRGNGDITSYNIDCGSHLPSALSTTNKQSPRKGVDLCSTFRLPCRSCSSEFERARGRRRSIADGCARKVALSAHGRMSRSLLVGVHARVTRFTRVYLRSKKAAKRGGRSCGTEARNARSIGVGVNERATVSGRRALVFTCCAHVESIRRRTCSTGGSVSGLRNIVG